MRTREYVEKGEDRRKSSARCHARRLQRRHAALRRRNRKAHPPGVVDLETGLTYATNAGNLRLELADFIDSRPKAEHHTLEAKDAELEIIR